MSRNPALALLAAALCAAAACRRGPAAPRAATAGAVPKGDVLWLRDPAAAGETGLADRLKRLGAAAVFLPAGDVALRGGRFVLEPFSPAAGLPPRTPIVFVVGGGPEIDSAVRSAAGPDAAGIARAITAALAPMLGASAAHGSGRVAGIHLDFPFAAGCGPSCAELVRQVRQGVPPGTFVSISLDEAPADEDARRRIAPLVSEADALSAPVFGYAALADPTRVDALRRPWWPVFNTAARGRKITGNGPAQAVPEKYLDALSGNARVDLENDLSVDDSTSSAFQFAARQPVRVGDLDLQPGERIAFRVPLVPELLFQLGATMAGKHFALGRAFVFDGASEGDRVLPIAALEDVLLGRSLAPRLEVSVSSAGGRAVLVEAVNRAHHASIVSRFSNWVEVDLSPAHPGDVQPGGFDRYELYDAGGHAVASGRATRVRFFETLVGPDESISPARIVVRGKLANGCCAHRTHVAGAAGPEQSTDWSAPPAPAPSAPAKPVSRRRK